MRTRLRHLLAVCAALGAGLGAGAAMATLTGALADGDTAPCTVTATTPCPASVVLSSNTTDETTVTTTDVATETTVPSPTTETTVSSPTTETTVPPEPTTTTDAPPAVAQRVVSPAHGAEQATVTTSTEPAPAPAAVTTATTVPLEPTTTTAVAPQAVAPQAVATSVVSPAHGAEQATIAVDAARPRALQDRRPRAHRRLPAGVHLPSAVQARAAAAPSAIDVAAFGPLRAPAFGPGAATSIPFPTWLLAIYEAASAQYGVPWPVLAAINEIETDYGHDARVSSAGAVGWMQFMPSTWARYGTDADGDGVADPAHPVDAVFSAARYLRDAGADHDLARAVFAYNHAGWYVQHVLERARVLGGLRADLAASLAADGAEHGRHLLAPDAPVDSLGRAMLLDARGLRDAVLHDPHITIYPCGRQDIAAGDIDRRVLLVLEALRFAGMDPTVSSLHCGHGFYTSSGNVSEHSSGAAVDVAAINGVPILGHQGIGTITDKAIRLLLGLQDVLGAHQIISLMTYPGRAETLALPDHADHIHVGFHPLRPLLGEDTHA